MVVVYFIVAGMCWNGGQRLGRRKMRDEEEE